MSGWSQNGTGYDIEERVQKVAMLAWDTDTLSWVRQGSMTSTAAANTNAARQTVFDKVDATTTYIGKAAPGALQSDPAWTITRILFDGSGNPTSITHANDGSPAAQWSLRAGLTYS